MLREQRLMAFDELRFLLLEAFDQRGKVLFGGNRHRTADKQRGGQRSREPMDADSCVHGCRSSFQFVVAFRDHGTK